MAVEALLGAAVLAIALVALGALLLGLRQSRPAAPEDVQHEGRLPSCVAVMWADSQLPDSAVGELADVLRWYVPQQGPTIQA
jgi:hypothetical protein